MDGSPDLPCGCEIGDNGAVIAACDMHAEDAAEYSSECCCPACGRHEDDCECALEVA